MTIGAAGDSTAFTSGLDTAAEQYNGNESDDWAESGDLDNGEPEVLEVFDLHSQSDPLGALSSLSEQSLSVDESPLE
jgi:hypothetical protein